MKFDRRTFLRYVGYGAGAALLGPLTPRAAHAVPTADKLTGRWVKPDGSPDWTPVAYPLPHPGDGGNAATDPQRFATYTVRDELVLPQGFRYDVIAQWGDRFGPLNDPDRQITFGFNADYTGLVPIAGSEDEYWLVVNHEYISARSWLQGYEIAHGTPLPRLRLLAADNVLEIDGVRQQAASVDLLNETTRGTERAAAAAICRAAMDDLGASVLRVRRLADGRFEVVREATDHKRFSGTRAVNAMGNAAPTFANCSGGTTPWGTVLTCEENFQDQVMEWIDARGEPIPDRRKPFAGLGIDEHTNLPFEFEGLGQGIDPPLDGRDFGWVCEIDPQAGTLVKLPTLGRFRHENVALRCEPGKPLAAYLGDDRRGGHVWKFVSRGIVQDPKDPHNRELLRDGTLYVARFDAGYTGRWLPLTPDTPLTKPQPDHCSTGHLWLPDRQVGGHVAVGNGRSKHQAVSVRRWVASIERFTGKPFGACTLGDLVDPSVSDPQRVILLDAYVMANAIGGTPCSRPEDLEVHPHDQSVYIAFTDSTGSGDGSPDVRIFPDSHGDNSRQYGAVYRLAEDDDNPAAMTFTWGKFVSSGELAEEGAGFACADNLVFDPDGNLWIVTDITTPAHNFEADRDEPADSPGGKTFVGVFGNNALFMIPTRGPLAGVPHCFAIGPMECEITGPTFTDDGRTLLLAIQHPGELHGAREGERQVERTLTLAARDGSLFRQTRTVPLGSNFPSGQDGDAPRPCVVCITRTS